METITMNKLKYKAFLKETNHTEKSINSRVRNLERVERYFKMNIDVIICDKSQVINLLKEIREKNIDTKNQNMSNAIRKYYECITKDKVGRIF